MKSCRFNKCFYLGSSAWSGIEEVKKKGKDKKKMMMNCYFVIMINGVRKIIK